MKKAISQAIGKWLLVLGSMCAQQTWACDVTQPKCVAVNKILDKLQYRETLLEAQRGCSINAEERSPKALAKSGVLKLLGIKNTDAESLSEAHDRFVSAACGAEEVIQVILNIYRNEWLVAEGEADLQKMAAVGVEIDRVKRAKIGEAARVKAATLLIAMQAKASEEYEDDMKRLSGGLTQISDACPGGEVDQRTQTCKTKR
jgi:hypothetical protein